MYRGCYVQGASREVCIQGEREVSRRGLEYPPLGIRDTMGYGWLAGDMHPTAMLSRLLFFRCFAVVHRFRCRQTSDMDRWHHSRQWVDSTSHHAQLPGGDHQQIQVPLVHSGGSIGMCAPILSHFFHFYSVFGNKIGKEECIPVGWVPTSSVVVLEWGSVHPLVHTHPCPPPVYTSRPHTPLSTAFIHTSLWTDKKTLY